MFQAANENPDVFDEWYELLLDDLSGFLWNSKKDLGLSWEEIAEKANLSKKTVEKLMWRETRRPQMRTVYAIMRVLGMQGTFKIWGAPVGRDEFDISRYRGEVRRRAA